jgi:hypothetical protein
MANAAHNSRPNRESVSKRIGAKATSWIWRRDRCKCAYCGVALRPGRKAHLDHLEPQAHGGQDLVVNLVLACDRCNSARQDMTLAQWAAYARATYGITFRPEAILARATTPAPKAMVGRARSWAGCPVAA